MGLFDGLLRGLGFEVEEKPQKEKKTKIDTKKIEQDFSSAGAKFDLEKKSEKPKIQEQLKPKEIVATSQQDVQKIILDLKSYKLVIVDLGGLSQEDFVRALDFLSGAVFALEGKIQKIESKKYFICL